jgi:predicted metallo-beta-lactamase superfamily hydrolase
MINQGQKNRAANFLSLLKEEDVDIEYADSRSFTFGDAEVQFSAPVPHGSTAQRGYVIEVCVKAGGVFLQTSDVQGPLLDEQVEFILQEEPDLLYVDGPSSYLGYPDMQYELRDANENLVKIVRAGWIDRLVVDHHLTRDLKYREKIEPVLKAGEEVGVTEECAAEFLNLKPNLLEARRRELYKANGDDFDAG